MVPSKIKWVGPPRGCSPRRRSGRRRQGSASGLGRMRSWRNTVEIVLFEISNSMKPYPSVVHAYTSKLRPVICCLSQNNSMRFPTVFRQPLTAKVYLLNTTTRQSSRKEPEAPETTCTPFKTPEALRPYNSRGSLSLQAGTISTTRERHDSERRLLWSKAGKSPPAWSAALEGARNHPGWAAA